MVQAFTSLDVHVRTDTGHIPHKLQKKKKRRKQTLRRQSIPRDKLHIPSFPHFVHKTHAGSARCTTSLLHDDNRLFYKLLLAKAD